MVTNLPLRCALGASVARVLLGAAFVLVQLSSPGEGAMIVVLDIPTLAVLFTVGSVFGWPCGVTDAYDLTFLGFGLMSWFLLGLVIGTLVQRIARWTNAH